MFVHRLAAVAAVAAVALALSSCSEDPVKPKPLEPESSSSSPTSTPSETPKPESAEDFIRRWMAAEERDAGNRRHRRPTVRSPATVCRATTSRTTSTASTRTAATSSSRAREFSGITRTGGSRRAPIFEMSTTFGSNNVHRREGRPREVAHGRHGHLPGDSRTQERRLVRYEFHRSWPHDRSSRSQRRCPSSCSSPGSSLVSVAARLCAPPNAAQAVICRMSTSECKSMPSRRPVGWSLPGMATRTP